MRNGFETTIKLQRRDICDLIAACHAAGKAAKGTNWKVGKWGELREKLQMQLDELDDQLDMIVETESARA